MKQKLIKEMETILNGRLSTAEPLAQYTTWQIGGPAAVIAYPADLESFSRLAGLLTTSGTPWFVLGNGSNILADDQGFDGVVVTFRKNKEQIDIKEDRVTATAGTRLAAVINAAQAKGLSGLEELCGIPGTVGGALATNAGVPGRAAGDQVTDLTVVTGDGEVNGIEPDKGMFSYRSSNVKEQGTVWQAGFTLKPADPKVIQNTITDRLARRKQSQPLGENSAGSVFKNPEGTFAAQLIESCGCKGWQEGNAVVSPKHANFIVNTGGATARDVKKLISRIQNEVLKQCNVELELEVECVPEEKR